MIRCVDIGIGLLVAGFVFIFLGSAFGLSMAAYLAGACFVCSLFLYKNISPKVGICIAFLSLLLMLISPSPYIMAALFPLMGFFFSGRNKYSSVHAKGTRYALFFGISFIYTVSIIIGFESSSGSHNQLSVFVALALIAEILYFGKPSRLYIALIFISFFVFGNRSSIFLMASFIKNKLALAVFVSISIFFVSITLEIIDPPDFLAFLFDKGAFLYRSYREARAIYLEEFMESFSFLNLSYDGWRFSEVPQTSSGFYDLHNSFLTIIVRDSYLGIFKLFLWVITIFYLPLGIFLAITLRAFNDTFLLGGVSDVVLNALIGRSIISLWGDLNIFFNKYATLTVSND